MNHNVFDIVKIVFDTVMYMLCNVMSVSKWKISIHRNLRVYVDLVAEHSGTKHIQMDNSRLLGNIIADFIFVLFAARGIEHFIQGIPENIIRYFQNKDTDDNAGDRIQNRKSKHGACNTDQGADGRECINSRGTDSNRRKF